MSLQCSINQRQGSLQLQLPIVYFTHGGSRHSLATSYMNAAARLGIDTVRYEHIKSVLCRILHFLPVPQQITLMIAVLVINYIGSTGNANINDICTPLVTPADLVLITNTKLGG